MNLTRYNTSTIRRIVRYADQNGIGDMASAVRRLHTEYAGVAKHASEATFIAPATVRKLWYEQGLPLKRKACTGRATQILLPNGMSMSEYALSLGQPAPGAFYQRMRRHFLKTGEVLTLASKPRRVSRTPRC